MVLQRVPLQESKGIPGVIACNPTQLDELFKRAVVSKRVQRLLESQVLSSFVLALEPRVIQYDHQELVINGKILVRLPHNTQEAEYMRRLPLAEVWEVSEEDLQKMVTINGDNLMFDGGTPAEQEEFKKFWESAGVDTPLLSRLLGIAKESLQGLFYKKRATGSTYPFPLFREGFLSVFGGTKREALDIILERLRQRYVAKRDISKVPSGLVVTPNLDHIRTLFEDADPEFQEIYKKSFLQTADGYPPLVMYGKASLGFQPAEQVTGVDLFMQLINTIGSQALPYTIYLVGGFGNIPFKTRDYFVSIYPNLRENFVGVSTPPVGFLKNADIMTSILKDIEEKKPDIIFAGMTMPVQEKFINELMKRNVNFGIGFCIGRAIEMVAGYQKKEPAIIDKLHLAWIYRMLFGDRQDIKKRQQNRVIKDFKFVFKTLFSK